MPPPVNIRPSIPNIDPTLERDCKDPGVPDKLESVPQATEIIGATRVWAVCERGKKRGAVASYKRMQEGFGSPK